MARFRAQPALSCPAGMFSSTTVIGCGIDCDARRVTEAVWSVPIIGKNQNFQAGPRDRSSGFVPLKRKRCKTISNVRRFVVGRYGYHRKF